jgi:hypothetical protein
MFIPPEKVFEHICLCSKPLRKVARLFDAQTRAKMNVQKAAHECAYAPPAFVSQAGSPMYIEAKASGLRH